MFNPQLINSGKWVSACPTGSPAGQATPCLLVTGAYRHWFVRIRTISGTAPTTSAVTGYNFTGSNHAGSPSGTLPAFDNTADLDGDGYLNSTEYPNRASGKNAYFWYQGRCLSGGASYGQMRP